MPILLSQIDAALIKVFGETITYTPDGGSDASITGFFQEPDVLPPGNELEILTQGPMVTVLKEDVPTPSQQDTILRAGQLYQVKSFEIDEGELVGLQLEEL